MIHVVLTRKNEVVDYSCDFSTRELAIERATQMIQKYGLELPTTIKSLNRIGGYTLELVNW